MTKPKFIFLVSLLLLLAPPPATKGVTVAGEQKTTADDAREEPPPTSEWQILTIRNFTSQIRQNPHILILVTIPWSGEARALRKEVIRLVPTLNLRELKLMVVHMNSEKLLARSLGATGETTLVYYHHGRRLMYEGKLRARSILGAVSYLMSFQSEEVPFEFLNGEEELQAFLRSTDEAVLLLEFCGWSGRLLNKKDGGSDGTAGSASRFSGNGDILGEAPSLGNESLSCSSVENQKIQENNRETCEIENVMHKVSWFEQVLQDHARTSSKEMHCTLDEFFGFETFFQEFTKAAREFFFPPEKLRFGLVSNRSLLPLLGFGGSNSWMLIHWISGCQNCSKVFQEGENIRTILQTQIFPVTELDGDQSNHYTTFPSNMPSMILFIDRSSDSPKVHEVSNSALAIFRRFAQQNKPSNKISQHNQPSCEKKGDHNDNNCGETSLQGYHGVSSVRGPLRSELYSGKSIVQSKDNVNFIIMNEGKVTTTERTTDHAKESSAFELLAELIRQKTPLSKPKLSLIAKQVGFQLLSEDFVVKEIGSISSDKDGDQPVGKYRSTEKSASSSETQTSVLDDNSHNIVVEPTLNGNEDEKHHETLGVCQHVDEVPHDVSCTTLSSYKSCLENTGASPHDTEITKNHKCLRENAYNLHTHCSENSNDKTDQSTTDVRYLVDHEQHHYSTEISSESLDLTSVRSDERPEDDSIVDENEHHNFGFSGSYYFSDGGYRLLEALTGSSTIPTVVILDPISEQHYLLSMKELRHSHLVDFANKFKNGGLHPYQRSELIVASPNVVPNPPSVNLDFHKVDLIPRMSNEMLSEIVLGFIAAVDNHVHDSKKDILVLFSNSWCGFCNRMELVVHEVYRALSVFSTKVTKSKDHFGKGIDIVPSIFYIDCTHNECGSNLKLLGKEENFPLLLLLPAKTKDVVSYEGDMSVNNIIKFIASYGTNTHYLNNFEGILWTDLQHGDIQNEVSQDTSYVTRSEKFVEDIEHHESPLLANLIGGEYYQSTSPHAMGYFLSREHPVNLVVGTILSATVKLKNTTPFGSSSILMVRVNKNEGFQGLIINKRIAWEAFKEQVEHFDSIKHAPLFYGGPVILQNRPLVSLAKEAKDGYSEVREGLYFGDPHVTAGSVEAIISGKQFAADYWFFLGFSAWGWNQLFSEIAEGAWDLSKKKIEHVNWPEN